MLRHRLPLALSLAAALASTGCRTTETRTGLKDGPGDAVAPQTDAPKLCMAYRGNGPLIFAHFAATARLVEHYGPVTGLAGGSSGSIAAFVYESMYANPAVHDCSAQGGGACSQAALGARLSLLLKSLQAYVGLLGTSGEAVAVQQLVPIYKKARAMGIDALVADERAEARDALLTLLKSQEIKDVINPEIVTLLQTSQTPAYHAQEVWAGIAALGSWEANDPKMLFRPGLLDFKALGRKFGRIGSFYAGYGPADRAKTTAFLDACAEPARGKSWAAVAALPAGEAGGTCGEVFLSLLTSYRAKLLANESAYPSRIDDRIGRYLPALIPTSLLEGADAAGRYAKSRANFLAGKPLAFSMSFDLLRLGYWGRAADLERVASNPRGYTDLKSSHFLSLGEGTWGEALSYSPAEPGLTRLLEMSPTRVSASGWYDLHPTLVLRNMGCENVVYVTREGDEGGYPVGVARLLGLNDAQFKALYDLDDPASSLSMSGNEAQGIWCTDWNKFDGLDVPAIWKHTYEDSPFEVRSAFFTSSPTPYAKASPAVNRRGCTPGASN